MARLLGCDVRKVLLNCRAYLHEKGFKEGA